MGMKYYGSSMKLLIQLTGLLKFLFCLQFLFASRLGTEFRIWRMKKYRYTRKCRFLSQKRRIRIFSREADCKFYSDWFLKSGHTIQKP